MSPCNCLGDGNTCDFCEMESELFRLRTREAILLEVLRAAKAVADESCFGDYCDENCANIKIKEVIAKAKQAGIE